MLDRNALKAEFVKNGLTQRDVAKMIGKSEKTFISRMKKGSFGTDEAAIMIRELKIEGGCNVQYAPFFLRIE